MGYEPKIDSNKIPDKTGDDAEDKKRRIANPNLAEANPEVFTKSHEMSWGNRHNSSITLKKDYGRERETNAGAIDICVGMVDNVSKEGRAGVSLQRDANAKTRQQEGPSQPFASGDLARDAARVYLSQKCDVDSLFRLPGESTTARSATVLKADAIRIISRDAAGGIKLVCAPEAENSKGGDAGGASGVQLISSREEDSMQSMVKATDLALFLNDFMQVVLDLKNLVYEFQTAQKEFNRGVATKVDISPFYGAGIVVDPSLVEQMCMTSLDLFNKVENDCRSIEGRITDLTADLGLIDAEEGMSLSTINEPVFASKFHKLD